MTNELTLGGSGESAGAAFAALGNETRVAILEALWNVPDGRPLSFAELREAVGMRDSGQFNYHLGKLTDRFVEKTDEGYRLRFAGVAVVTAIIAGSYESAHESATVPLADPCPLCDGAMEMEYADDRATIRCADCEERFSSGSIPSGLFDGYDREAWPDVFERWLRSETAGLADGICMACQGRVEGELTLGPVEMRSEREPMDGPLVHHECTRCGARVVAHVGELLRDHPAVVAFYWERGVDVNEESTWRLPWLHEEPTVVSTDPPAVAVVVEHEGNELRLTVDESLDVTVG